MPKTWFSTPLSKNAKDTEGRIRNIFEGQRRRPAVIVLALVAAVALLCGSVVAVRARESAGAPMINSGTNTIRWSGGRDSVSSASLWSAGREFTAEESESVGQVLDAIGSVVFTRGGDANAPGAQSLVATIRYRDGTEEHVTFPCWKRDGVTYDAGADSIERFAPFFADWPEPQKEEAAGAENAESGGSRLRHLLTQLSPADVRMRFYDYEGLRGSVDGASALMAADYLQAFAEIEWVDAGAIDEDSRAGDWHIELDAPGWRLTSYQSSREVLVETGGEELWLIARTIPDTQYTWISFETLENWYLDAASAETHCRPQIEAFPNDRPLTGEELRTWREELATIREDQQTVASCFFTSYYSDPRDLDLFEFLYYCPLGESASDDYGTVVDESERTALLATGKYPGDFVPTHRYRVSTINAALAQYAGITLDDLRSDWRNDARILYLPQYDAFYNFSSDFGPGVFYPRYGERRDNVVTLWSDTAVVELMTTGDGWQIQSHMAITD